MNRERVLSDAKTRALEMVRAGYEPPVMRTEHSRSRREHSCRSENGSPPDAAKRVHQRSRLKLGTKIAEVLCGGNITPGTPVSEQYLLDLEREAFKSLCGEKKTQERIQFTLKTGKTLRN
jgi:3-hydroxyacyl-CoA dehydrogenase